MQPFFAVYIPLTLLHLRFVAHFSLSEIPCLYWRSLVSALAAAAYTLGVLVELGFPGAVFAGLLISAVIGVAVYATTRRSWVQPPKVLHEVRHDRLV